MLRSVIGFCLTLLLFLSVRGGQPVQAQIGLESRIARLESELFSLRSQVTQLQARLGSGARVPESRSLPPIQRSAPVTPSGDMFDRLATLVIELKDRMNQVEARLSRLDGQRSRPTPLTK